MRIGVFIALIVACVAGVAGAQSGEKDAKHARASISGVITGVDAVAVTLAGAVTASTTTDASGTYSFVSLPRGSYTVTASKPGYAFSPDSRAVVVKGTDRITGQDFGVTWALDGATWSFCRLEQNMPQDEWESFTFIGDTLFRNQLEYASTDSSCTGQFHGQVENAWAATIALGGDVEVPLDGTTVTARALEVVAEDGTPWSGFLYVDTAQVPDALHLGLDAVPELWPRAYMKEEPHGVSAPALQGTWSSCSTEVTGDVGEVFTISGYHVSVAGTSYASNDGSCSGAATPAFDDGVSFALRGTTPAMLRDGAVVAREVDAVFGSGGQLYSIMYIDTSTTPNVLYTGDETADPARDGTAPDRRPLVLQHWKARVKQP